MHINMYATLFPLHKKGTHHMRASEGLVPLVHCGGCPVLWGVQICTGTVSKINVNCGTGSCQAHPVYGPICINRPHAGPMLPQCSTDAAPKQPLCSPHVSPLQPPCSLHARLLGSPLLQVPLMASTRSSRWSKLESPAVGSL